MTPNPLLPGSTIGVVGGGQLGRMLVLEARRMGYRTVILDADPDAPAAQLAEEHIRAPLADVDAARELAARSDVITLEWENADVAAMRALEHLKPVRPAPSVLEIAQNRLLEKQHAQRLGLETAAFAAVRSLAELTDAVATLGTPCVVKTTTGGYDGKGQRVIRSAAETGAAFEELSAEAPELIAEAWVDFQMEISVICARSPDGTVTSFPVVENIHRNGILDFSIAPARLSESLQRKAVEIGETLIRGLDVIGLLAVELFVTRDDRLFVNEIAPRPHNSGHYTWEACSLSQFEQHLRAVCGLPLATPVLLKPAAMANLLGEHAGTGLNLPAVADVLREPMLSLHLYGKREARARRKMGHLTVLADTSTRAYERVAAARRRIESEFDAKARQSGELRA